MIIWTERASFDVFGLKVVAVASMLIPHTLSIHWLSCNYPSTSVLQKHAPNLPSNWLLQNNLVQA